MTERYFDKFPTTVYANRNAVNILERAVLINQQYANPNLYYQYDVQSGERPDLISSKYYNDPYMSWILYMVNNVVDPYYGWYMDQDTFNAFVSQKYGSYQKAVSKIKFFRNNWYSDVNSISSSTFSSLSADVQAFYQPNYGNNVYGTIPLNYVRRQVDWSITTNQIVGFTVTNGSPFIFDELVNINYNGTQIGSGQVCFSNSTYVTLQHITNTAVSTITGTCFLYGTESSTNTTFSAVTALANNIPSTQTEYWSPVTYYNYEQEINESNKSIYILKSEYSVKFANQLKRIL
jgi:hypothetical protein